MVLGSGSTTRRERLKANITVNDVMNSVAIGKYYDLADRTLSAAESRSSKVVEAVSSKSWEEAVKRYKDLDEAYVFWKRFARLAIEVIPSHNYYNSPLHVAEKRRLQTKQKLCLEALEKLVAAMDADELLIEAERGRRKVELERLERERAAEAERLERERAADAERRKKQLAAEAERRKKQLAIETERIRQADEARRRAIEEARKKQELDEAMEEERAKEEEEARIKEEEEEEEEFAKGEAVSYNDRGMWVDAVVVRVHYDDAPPYYTIKVLAAPSREVQTVLAKLRRRTADSDAALLGAKPLDEAPGALDGLLSVTTPVTPPPKATTLGVRDLKAAVADEWRRRGGRVESLSTYQGRVRDARGLDSTNGCAVIAPLTCYQHITTPGASNGDISRLIDNVVPPILAHVRSKHGLGHGAFIIPSDVHDYLYDQGAIRREMFEGVYGGNVLDDGHISNLATALASVPASERAAAAFFFKEHVTAILRVGLNEYHFVDSMPGSRGFGTRTVCPDEAALHTYLKFYALNKFSHRDLSHIDTTPWSDLQAEFDPRVFQAFVWHFKPPVCVPN